LVSHEYSKPFLIFSFASQDTIAAILLQKDSENKEAPITIFSRALRYGELKYEMLEKHAYALVKALKSFIVYILHAQVIAYVPSSIVREILVQPDIDGKRSKGVTKVLEFDLEIKPTKLIKGQGLAKLLAEENCKVLGLNFMDDNLEGKILEPVDDMTVDSKLAKCNWYKDVIYFLKYFKPPPDYDKTRVRLLKLKTIKYCI